MAKELEIKKVPEFGQKESAGMRPELESPKEMRESAPDTRSETVERTEKPQEMPTRAPVQAQPVQIVQKDKILMGIEHILSENLGDAYLSMPPEKRTAFKRRGEEVAAKIKGMVDKGNVHMHKILMWIRDWLRMIPGVNTFFLEQEAKIKADRLLEYYKKQTGR